MNINHGGKKTFSLVTYEKNVKDLGICKIFVRREGGAMKNDWGGE